MIYGRGTVTVTNGSDIVTGLGTAWNEYEIYYDLDFSVDGGVTVYKISMVNGPEEIKLQSAYAEETAEGVNYQIEIPQKQFMDITVSKNEILEGETVIVDGTPDEVDLRMSFSGYPKVFVAKGGNLPFVFHLGEAGFAYMVLKRPGYFEYNATIGIKPLPDNQFVDYTGEPLVDRDDNYCVGDEDNG